MKHLIYALGLAVVMSGSSLLADAPDDEYIRIYHLLQQGDENNKAGNSRSAFERYQQAQAALKAMQNTYPDWRPKLVEFRLAYVSEKLTQFGFSSTAPVVTTSPEPPTRTDSTPAVEKTTAPVTIPATPASASVPMQNQLAAMMDENRRLNSEKALLEAKLKEALAAQPATMDPRELAKAEEKIRTLQKENELYKVTLQQEQSKQAKLAKPNEIEGLQKSLADANQKLAEQSQVITILKQEKEVMQLRVKQAAEPAQIKQLKAENDRLKKDLAEGQVQAKKAAAQSDTKLTRADNRQLKQLQSENEQLKKDLADAKAKIKTPTMPAPAPVVVPAVDTTQLQKAQKEWDVTRKQLESENAGLKKQLADSQARLEKPVAATEDKRARLESIEIKQLQGENEKLKKQIAELQGKPAPVAISLPAAVPAPVVDNKAEAKQIKQLQQERDDLQKKLAAATAKLNKRQPLKGEGPDAEQLSSQVKALQAKLDVFEAKKVPYSKEEIEQFERPQAQVRPPETKPAQAEKKSEPPAAVGMLVADAQRAYAGGRLDEAESKYQQAIKLDDKSLVNIGNLAAIQMQRGNLAEAEKTIKQALVLDPNDAHNLSLLGLLKFRQEKFDEALDCLSQSAKLDPKNATTFNYLGMTLGQKGQREAAETALRKAVQIAPDYAGAHYNLAVIYAYQTPPYLALARYHYNRATANGYERNAELEKTLAEKK